MPYRSSLPTWPMNKTVVSMLSCGTKVSAWASWPRKIKRVSSGLRSEIHPPPSPPWDIRLPEIGTEHERASAEKQAVVCGCIAGRIAGVCVCGGGHRASVQLLTRVAPFVPGDILLAAESHEENQRTCMGWADGAHRASNRRGRAPRTHVVVMFWPLISQFLSTLQTFRAIFKRSS